MDMERANKRPRVTGTFGGGSDMEEFDVMGARRANDLRLKSRFEQIFEKYAKDFTTIGDEIDLETGDIIVDNGHIQTMRNEQDLGGQMWASLNTEDPTLKDMPHNEHVTPSYSAQPSLDPITGVTVMPNGNGHGFRGVVSSHFEEPYDGSYKSGGGQAFDLSSVQAGIMQNTRDEDDATQPTPNSASLHDHNDPLRSTDTDSYKSAAAQQKNLQFQSNEIIDPLWQAPEINGLTRNSPIHRSPPPETPRTYRRSLSPNAVSLWAAPKTRRRRTGNAAMYSKRTPKTVPKPRLSKAQTGYESADSDDPLQDDFHSPLVFRVAPTKIMATDSSSSPNEVVKQRHVSEGRTPSPTQDYQHIYAASLPPVTDDDAVTRVDTDIFSPVTEPYTAHENSLDEAYHPPLQREHPKRAVELPEDNIDEMIAQVGMDKSPPERGSSMVPRNLFDEEPTSSCGDDHHAHTAKPPEGNDEEAMEAESNSALQGSLESPESVSHQESNRVSSSDEGEMIGAGPGLNLEDLRGSGSQMQIPTSTPRVKSTSSHKLVTPSDAKTIVTLRIAEKRSWKEVLASIPARKPSQIRNWYSNHCTTFKTSPPSSLVSWSAQEIEKLSTLVPSPPQCWDDLSAIFPDRSTKEIEYQWIKLCIGEETWENWRTARTAPQKQDDNNPETTDELEMTPFRPPMPFLPSSVSQPKTPISLQRNPSETQTPILPSRGIIDIADDDSDSDDPLSEAFDSVWQGAGLSSIGIDTPPRLSISPKKTSPNKKAFARIANASFGVGSGNKPN